MFVFHGPCLERRTGVLAITAALKIDAEALRTLAETFERADAAEKQTKRNELLRDLNDLQHLAIEAAIEARGRTGQQGRQAFQTSIF